MYQSIEKSTIRKKMLEKRISLDEEFLKISQKSFLKHLKEFPLYQSSKTIMLYMDYRKEASTNDILNFSLKCKKKIILPVTNDNLRIVPYELTAEEGSLLTSKLGIREPNPLVCPRANPKEIDMVVIPGVAFDYKGNRIGFGKGCYDYFLPTLRSDAVKVGLCYEFQRLENIPSEVTDIPMDFLLTEQRIYKILRP